MEPEHIVVSAFKRSEDGKGYVARLRETEGRATRSILRVPSLNGCRNAYLANGVEDIEKPLRLRGNVVELELQPWDIVTVKFE